RAGGRAVADPQVAPVVRRGRTGEEEFVARVEDLVDAGKRQAEKLRAAGGTVRDAEPAIALEDSTLAESAHESRDVIRVAGLQTDDHRGAGLCAVGAPQLVFAIVTRAGDEKDHLVRRREDYLVDGSGHGDGQRSRRGAVAAPERFAVG